MKAADINTIIINLVYRNRILSCLLQIFLVRAAGPLSKYTGSWLFRPSGEPYWKGVLSEELSSSQAQEKEFGVWEVMDEASRRNTRGHCAGFWEQGPGEGPGPGVGLDRGRASQSR